MAEKIREHTKNMTPVKKSAQLLRESFKNTDFDLQDRFCDAQDLDTAWKNISIPDPIMVFFSELFGLKTDDFRYSKIKAKMPEFRKS